MDPITITTLTPAEVQENLQNDGLGTLGLTTLSLAPRWTNVTPLAAAYDAAQLTLNLVTLRAPFRGILEFAFPSATSTLASALSNSATSITVAGGEGARFPSPTGGSVLLTLSNASGSKVEVVGCTSRAGDTLTITRGALGSTAQSFSPGDRVTLRLTPHTRSDAFTGADGNPLALPAAVLRLHPQAVLRLENLAAERYAAPGNPAILPVPWAMAVRGAQGFTSARWYEADEIIPSVSGAVSFHDGRGLPIDPIYVAALFADLQAWLGGLLPESPSGPAAGPGGVQPIAALASGTLVHCVDLHGAVYQPALPAATLVTRNGSDTVTGPVPASGLVTLAAGDGISVATGDNNRLRWGWATNGLLARTRLVPPALPAGGAPAPALGRQFYRVAVIDAVWALLGNRTASAVLGIAADDQTILADMLPVVRDLVAIDCLVDGPDTLGRSSAVLARPLQNMVLAVSPVLDGTMVIPAQAGPNAHWPAFPAPDTGQGFPTPPVSPATGITAAWTSGNDVVVTLVASAAPAGAHIRIYPQQFVTIVAIAEEPSFVRGHGGAAIAQAGAATQVLLPNPFNLAAGAPRPSPATLTLDIVVAPRAGGRRLWAAVSVPVAAGPVTPPANPFAGVNVVGALPDTFKSIAPTPLFGIPTTVTPPGAPPPGAIGLIRALASETTPRQGPRLPTMARFETIITTGTTGGAPAGTLRWEAVLSGGRWAPETRSAFHAEGNPGNPAGPDLHAPGIHVTGALAYDLARHAMRRAQPIIPLPGAPVPSWSWIVGMGGDNFNPPTDSDTDNTGIGVMLETVAAVCETPELSALTPPAPGATLQAMVNNIASSLGISPAPTITVGNEARLQAEVRREFIVSAAGLRDALWSLRRAIGQARELIYIDSPQFARTARPPQPAALDLVTDIAARLAAHPNLKVIICTPREADFAPHYRGWSRQHYQARNEAVASLLAAAADRVAVFHPVGFPGRPAFIRTTSVIVDDVWSLVGATHWRRRGFTFDGSAAIASFDRQMDRGYSREVRIYRRALMAARLAIPDPGGAATSAAWTQLGSPASAFALVTNLLQQGGLGQLQSLWPGPSDTAVLPATNDVADPDGSNGATFVATFASLLAELGD
jgi:hypothetical protein